MKPEDKEWIPTEEEVKEINDHFNQNVGFRGEPRPGYETTQIQTGQGPEQVEKPGVEKTDKPAKPNQPAKPDQPAKPGTPTPTKPSAEDKAFDDKLKQRDDLQKKIDKLVALDKQIRQILESLAKQADAAADLAVEAATKGYDDFKDAVKEYTSGKATEFLQEKLIDKLGKYGKLIEKGLELKEEIEGAIEKGERTADLLSGDLEKQANATKDFLKDVCPIGEEIDGLFTGAFDLAKAYQLTQHAEELGNMLNDQLKKNAWIMEDAGKLRGELGRLNEEIEKDPRFEKLSDETKEKIGQEIEDSAFFRDEPTSRELQNAGTKPQNSDTPSVPRPQSDLPKYFFYTS